MNGLLGMLEVVLDSPLNSDQREELEIAQRSAYALLALLNDILDLSKIEAGKMMIENIPYNVRTVLDDCVKSFQARATQKKIALHFEIDPRRPSKVIGDPLRVRQIAANLLSNALKFTERGWVCLRLSTAANAGGPAQMKIAVSDTGAGIEADKLTAIFEKFTQADGSITRKYGGTGLGLAITKRLVEMQDGKVNVESQVGKGSTFTVTLPWTPVAESDRVVPGAAAGVAAEEGHALASARAPGRRQSGEPESGAGDSAQEGLSHRRRQRRPRGAVETRAAWQRRIKPTIIVLMDVQMPVLDGLETTRIMRQNSRWDRLPIIAMTAHAMNGDRERCLQAGMNSYVSKPIQPAHLVSIIEKQLQEQTIETPAPQAPVSDNQRDHQVAAGRLRRWRTICLKCSCNWRPSAWSVWKPPRPKPMAPRLAASPGKYPRPPSNWLRAR